MATATLTSKGQITIPKEIRDSLKLHSGDRIHFEVTSDFEASMKPVTKSVDDVFGKLFQPNQIPKSIEEMNEAVSKRMRTKKG